MVLYFDIAMQDVVTVQELKATADLFEHTPDLFFPEG